MKSMRLSLAILLVAVLAAVSAFAQGNGQGNKKQQKQEQKQTNKEAKKLGNKAEEAAEGIGRNAVFCVLAAHTDIEDFETAQALKDKFESLTDFPFGQFVAAVLLVDRLDKEGFGLDEVIDFLVEDGLSIGEITRLAGVNMGEVRRGFGQMRSELARSMTNPPTKNCFETNP